MKFKALLAEFIGTFTLLFAGIGAIAIDQHLGGKLGLVGVALAHGLAIAVMVSALGAVSGGHFNPAVTLGLLVGKKIDIASAGGYWVAQLAGAAAGAFAIKFASDPAAIEVARCGIPALTEGITQIQAIVLEAVATFFLVITVYGTAVDSRAPKLGGLMIGLSITVGILFSGPLTGGALNVARWFGSAVAIGDWTNLAVYIVGPLAGGLIAGLVYSTMFSSEADAATA